MRKIIAVGVLALFLTQPSNTVHAGIMLVDFDYPVVMDAGQTVPPIALPDAFGFGNVTYDEGSGELTWTINYEALSGPLTVAHIHSGTAGNTGPVLVDLLGAGSTDNGSVITGSAMIDQNDAASIQSGQTYVNLHTMDNPGGEIRGQVGLREDFFLEAGLDPDQETVMLMGDVSAARGTGSVTFDAELDELSWSVEYSGLTSDTTVAHIHGPAAPGASAGVLVNIGTSGVDSPIVDSLLNPTGDILAALLAQRTYFNIHTMMNQGGEIRGQLVPIIFENGFEGSGLVL